MGEMHDTTEARLRWLEELGEQALHHGERERGRAAARAREAPRARATREAARPGLVRRARPLRAAPRGRVRHAREPAVGRRGRHGARDDLRTQGLRLLAGLHRVRRLALRGLRGEGLQGHGPGREVRLPCHRDQRLRRCADPGGRRLARRLRRDLLAQRAGLRCRPADLARDGAVRRAEPSTRPRSPTSCSWSRRRRTCSSPAPTS